MRMRDAFTIGTLNAIADAIARLPDALQLFVIFSGGGAFVALYLMTVRLFDGLLPLGMVILLWLCILALGYQVESAERKLVNAHNVLIDIAFQKCRCDPNAIIIEAPTEPELVGKPAPKGYCDYCQARAILKEQCPEVFEPRIRTYSTAEVFAEGCRSFMRIGTQKEFEAHQAKLEKEYPFEEELSQDEPKPGDSEFMRCSRRNCYGCKLN